MAASRRNVLLAGVAMGAAGVSMGQLSNCSNSGGSPVSPEVIDAITKIVATTCQAIPLVQTLVDIIVAAFPQAAGVATITDMVAGEIATYVCNLFHPANYQAGRVPTPRSAKIGNSTVQLHGYAVADGKIVPF